MKVQVLGSGCPTCKNLFAITQQAVAGMDGEIELEYVTGVEGMSRIIELGANQFHARRSPTNTKNSGNSLRALFSILAALPSLVLSDTHSSKLVITNPASANMRT